MRVDARFSAERSIPTTLHAFTCALVQKGQSPPPYVHFSAERSIPTTLRTFTCVLLQKGQSPPPYARLCALMCIYAHSHTFTHAGGFSLARFFRMSPPHPIRLLGS